MNKKGRLLNVILPIITIFGILLIWSVLAKAIDSEYNSTRMSIEEYREKIEKLFEELEVITKNSGGGIS